MPRKKKTETEITPVDVEKVEGKVEGLTYSAAEEAIRQETRKKWAVDINWEGFGKNMMSEVLGLEYINRARHISVKEARISSGAELCGMLDAYWDFILTAAEHGHAIVPVVESMASFLGVTRSTIERWKRGEDNLEFVDPINISLNQIAAIQNQLGLTGKLNVTAVAMNLNNNAGYVQAQKTNDVQLNVRIRNELPNREQLTQIVERLP